MEQKKPKLVYSTRAEANLSGEPKPGGVTVSLPPQQQTIRVSIDKKRRQGKTVTVAAGFQLAPADLQALEKTLKQLCGAGGTCKENEIEVQGEHRDKIMQKLAEMKFKVKRVGG